MGGDRRHAGGDDSAVVLAVTLALVPVLESAKKGAEGRQVASSTNGLVLTVSKATESQQ